MPGEKKLLILPLSFRAKFYPLQLFLSCVNNYIEPVAIPLLYGEKLFHHIFLFCKGIGSELFIQVWAYNYVFVHDPLYSVSIYTHPIADNLPVKKIWLLGNYKHTHTHTHTHRQWTVGMALTTNQSSTTVTHSQQKSSFWT